MDGRAPNRFGLMTVAALFGAAVIVGGLTSVEQPGEAAAVAAGSTLELQVTGVAGVPSDAVAVALNMTVVNAQAPGFATVYPCGQPRPEASNLNYAAGQTIPNLVIAKPGAGGKVCIYSYAAVDVLADVSGFFPAGSGFTPIPNPARILDTRPLALSPPASPDQRKMNYGSFDLFTQLAISYELEPAGSPLIFWRATSECMGSTPSGVCALRKIVAIKSEPSRSESVGECHVPDPTRADVWIRDSNCDRVPDDFLRPDEPTPRSNERICVPPLGGIALGWRRVDQYYPMLSNGEFSNEPVVLYFCPV